MPSMQTRTNYLATAGGLLIVAIALYMLMTRKTWFGQHLPLPLHPASPVPGTLPRMNRGIRSLIP